MIFLKLTERLVGIIKIMALAITLIVAQKNKQVSVPNTTFDKNSNPHNGNAYAGFLYSPYVYSFELLQTKLLESLKINKIYCLEFYIKNTIYDKFNINELSFLFSKKKIIEKTTDFYDDKTISENSFVVHKLTTEKKDNWTKVCVIYKPKAEEQFLTIGFNKTNDLLGLRKRTKNQQVFYYAIDDVSLLEIKDSSECSCKEVKTINKDSVKVEIVKSYYDSANVKAFVLNNLVFESNKSKLMPASNAELDKLVNYLKTNPTKTIELFGYTDNTGKELDNIKLSEARVKSVADYLINKGIESKRITFKGYGSKNPIKPNDTEFNKAKNRRVEFKIN
jgi:OOP family OmpA-OmpF porin